MLMGWFDLSLREAGRVTIAELGFYLQARQVKIQMFDSIGARAGMHAQRAGATKKSGNKYVSAYSAYDEYYDDVKELERIFNPREEKPQEKLDLAEMNRRMRKGGS